MSQVEIRSVNKTWQIGNNWDRKGAMLEGHQVDIPINRLFSDEQLQLDMRNGWGKAACRDRQVLAAFATCGDP